MFKSLGRNILNIKYYRGELFLGVGFWNIYKCICRYLGGWNLSLIGDLFMFYIFIMFIVKR